MIIRITLSVVLLSGGASACSYGLNPPKLEAGRDYFESRPIPAGADASEVRRLLGEPLEIETMENTQRWRYYMRVYGSEERRLFGLIRLPDSKSRGDYETIVLFRDGLVESSSRSHKRLDPSRH